MFNVILKDFSFYSIMGGNSVKMTEAKAAPALEGPVGADGKKLKPCCACPETKKVRDACIIENGEANCTDLIEAHKTCMRKMGFNI